MLKTAQQSIARSNVNILLAQAYAQNFQPSTFGVDQFDKIVFSYSLSIIPRIVSPAMPPTTMARPCLKL